MLGIIARFLDLALNIDQRGAFSHHLLDQWSQLGDQTIGLLDGKQFFRYPLIHFFFHNFTLSDGLISASADWSASMARSATCRLPRGSPWSALMRSDRKS